MVHSGIHSESVLMLSPDQCSLDVKSTNVCPPQVWEVLQHDKKMGPDGAVIFVNTDCNTRLPLDAIDQDPVYQHPEVPLDRGVSVGIQQAWNPNATWSATTYPHTGGADNPNTTYAIELFGIGMLYGSIGLNGSSL